jgi:hypothetical protein
MCPQRLANNDNETLNEMAWTRQFITSDHAKTILQGSVQANKNKVSKERDGKITSKNGLG